MALTISYTGAGFAVSDNLTDKLEEYVENYNFDEPETHLPALIDAMFEADAITRPTGLYIRVYDDTGEYPGITLNVSEYGGQLGLTSGWIDWSSIAMGFPAMLEAEGGYESAAMLAHFVKRVVDEANVILSLAAGTSVI